MRSALSMLALLAAAHAHAAAPPPASDPSRLPAASVDNALEVTGDSLKARERETRLSIDVAVNGHGPYAFMVDSGADRSVIGSGIAARLALPAAQRVLMHSMTGATMVDTVDIETLRIGGTEIAHLSAPALPERFLGADGLIGIDALADQRLMMDFDKHRITIQDTRAVRPDSASPDEIVVVARRRKGQLLLTGARADGITLSAVIDSGSQVTIGNSALRAKIFGRRHPPAVQPIPITSVTGETVIAELIVVPALDIGGIQFRDVPIAFQDVPPFALFGLTRDPAIMLGTDVLGAFRRVALDFRGRRVRFTLRPHSLLIDNPAISSVAPG